MSLIFRYWERHKLFTRIKRIVIIRRVYYPVGINMGRGPVPKHLWNISVYQYVPAYILSKLNCNRWFPVWTMHALCLETTISYFHWQTQTMKSLFFIKPLVNKIKIPKKSTDLSTFRFSLSKSTLTCPLNTTRWRLLEYTLPVITFLINPPTT